MQSVVAVCADQVVPAAHIYVPAVFFWYGMKKVSCCAVVAFSGRNCGASHCDNSRWRPHAPTSTWDRARQASTPPPCTPFTVRTHAMFILVQQCHRYSVLVPGTFVVGHTRV